LAVPEHLIVNITKMVCRNMVISYTVVFSKMLFNFYYYKN